MDSLPGAENKKDSPKKSHDKNWSPWRPFTSEIFEREEGKYKVYGYVKGHFWGRTFLRYRGT